MPELWEKTIGFQDWARGINAFRWKCPHCHSALSANSMTYIAFVFCFFMVLAILIGADFIELPEASNIMNFNEMSRIAKKIVLAVIMLPVAFLAFLKCGYKKA